MSKLALSRRRVSDGVARSAHAARPATTATTPGMPRYLEGPPDAVAQPTDASAVASAAIADRVMSNASCPACAAGVPCAACGKGIERSEGKPAPPSGGRRPESGAPAPGLGAGAPASAFPHAGESAPPRSQGNETRAAAFALHGVRAKLSVSRPHDPDEEEADRWADRVMGMPTAGPPATSPFVHTTAARASAKAQRDTRSPSLSRKPTASGPAPAASFAVPSRNGGRALNASARDFFEPRFGRDLGDVRIHDDAAAADSARRIGARAYAYGDQVVFGAGEFAPDSDAGRHLLAHELTHVLQASGGEQRIRRAPEDATRLNQLPLSAHRSRPHFTIAFYSVYAEATGDLPDFKARIKSACAESSEGLNLDAGNQGSVNAAADEMAELTDGLTVGGAYQSLDLAGAVKKVYELMPSLPGDIQVTSFGFEYIYGRLVSHSADFVALSLQEHAHGADIDADPDLSAMAGSSDTAFVQLSQDLARIVAALSDGKSLLMLELEGLVATLVDLRNQFDPRAARDEQAENYRMRSELARRALLVNDKLMKMTDDPTAPTALDTSVEKTLSEIRKTARSEEDTRTALGDTKSLLAAQPLNMAARVDDPFFAESGLNDEAEAAEIKPQVAFPKTTEGFAAAAQHDLADRINRQSEGLQGQLAKIVPPHEEAKYNLPEFAKVHQHWFSLFGIEAEKTVIQQAGALDLWHGIHQATAIGTLSVSGDTMTAWLRYETMKQTMGLLGLFVGTGVEREFGSVIAQQAMRRKQVLSGTGASDAQYEFAELYGSASSLTAAGEEASRSKVAAEGAETSSARFSRAASVPPFLQTEAAHQQGLTPAALPVLGLRKVEAKEGWSYLVEVPDYLSGKTIAYEQKTATPEVAEFLLAQRQHAATLKTTHSALVAVPSPGKFSNARTLRHVGPTPALEGAQTSQTSSLERADRGARKAIGMPGRGSSTTSPTGTELLQGAMLDYLNFFFKEGDSALRVAAIIHVMNVEHGIGKVFDKMLEPAEIAKVLTKAFGLGFGLGVLGSLGPIGRILSLGIGKAMKVAGGSDITAALTVAAFLKEAAETGDFFTARMMGYLGVPIVEDIKQLFESVISAPAAMAGAKAADASVKAVLDKINQKPPANIAEAADLARELANASPEARADMLAAMDSHIADMEAQGFGKTRSSQDYDFMIAFRNAFHQQSTRNQMLDPFTTRLETKVPDEAKTPFGGEPFRLKTPGERAKLLAAMGDLAGKVMLFQDPTLRGDDAATVQVHYDNGKVRIHHGSEASARDIELHMPTVRTLRKYEGFSGSVRSLLARAISLLGFTQTPQYGSKGFEAELEIKKLTEIRDDLFARQEAIDLNARRLIDKEIDNAIIDRHIADIDKQILQHMRDLDSLEAGQGFIAARKKSAGLVRAETLGLDQATPTGHYWREREGQLELVWQNEKAAGYFLNQDTLRAEIAKGKAGDPKLAIRPIAENASAGALKATAIGLGDAPKGHHWREDPSGGLKLVRTDEKAPHFWFDHDAYSKAADKSKPAKFIRPIAEKADSDSASFDARTWDEAYGELGGGEAKSSFGKFTKVIGGLGVDKVAIIDKMKQTEGGDSRGDSPNGLTIRTIRHTTKQHFINEVILPHLTDPRSLADSPRYQALIEQGIDPREAQIAASHERLLSITRQLDSADIGSLGEKWHTHWFAQAGDKTQFSVSQKDISDRYKGADIGQDRNLDLLKLVGDEQADLVEIKNVSSPVGERERGELDAHLALQGKDVMLPGAAGAKATPRTIRKVVWVILNPDFLTSHANVAFVTDRLKENAFLEFRIYDENGKMVPVTGANYRTVLAGLTAAAKKAKAAREAVP
ncbi:MAG: DUF4157 domain-containing protein [Candidatus Accumulibacter sp.]|uniref:eCIS core domain-containing protein n=1 Tax=Accumulibacter sp. TaxID=2053492 RepID=UPI001A38DA9C|nr:DUF4157 domain-containing protein [Accumulibacter sp.]MBL8369226.1 DUF4157 domain-containing protein [Accumulibacter sp.]